MINTLFDLTVSWTIPDPFVPCYPGDVLDILVGSQGENGFSNLECGPQSGGGGGGGSFVVRHVDSAPLIVAGGGGGAGDHSAIQANGGAGQVTPDGQNGGGSTKPGKQGTNGSGMVHDTVKSNNVLIMRRQLQLMRTTGAPL